MKKETMCFRLILFQICVCAPLLQITCLWRGFFHTKLLLIVNELSIYYIRKIVKNNLVSDRCVLFFLFTGIYLCNYYVRPILILEKKVSKYKCNLKLSNQTFSASIKAQSCCKYINILANSYCLFQSNWRVRLARNLNYENMLDSTSFFCSVRDFDICYLTLIFVI